MHPSDLPIRAATETAIAHGIVPDRCEILQDGNTLVLRLTETRVARAACDRDAEKLSWESDKYQDSCEPNFMVRLGNES